MPTIYRAMRADGAYPQCGCSKTTLGVKIGSEGTDDIVADRHGVVYPRTGGMSVAPSWQDLPAHRIPRRLRGKCPKAMGNNSMLCWKMGDGDFADGIISRELVLRVYRPGHGVVEPATRTSAEMYQAALESTQLSWEVDES